MNMNIKLKVNAIFSLLLLLVKASPGAAYSPLSAAPGRWVLGLLATFGCGLSSWLLNFNYCYIFHTPRTQEPARKWQWESGERDWERETVLGRENGSENGAGPIDAFFTFLFLLISVGISNYQTGATIVVV